MLFQSPIFLFLFLPLVLIINFLISKEYRNYFLLVASLFFYFFDEGSLALIMVLSIAINYLFGIALEFKFLQNKKKLVLYSAIFLNIALLVFFKYFNFFILNFNLLLTYIKIPAIQVVTIPLPVGISFFTFQAMSYFIDTYKGENKIQKNPFNLGMYVSLFPQLIAGPIVRYVDIDKEINDRKISIDDFTIGIKRFVEGLAKKVIFADTLGLLADKMFSFNPQNISMQTAWLGAICFTLQIYFDFSGYSDMAIGLGRMLGFKFLENFNYPYISKSIKEFWTRWHISLSTWFRDYVYIPLGGNRVSKFKNYINLWIVFLLCGLWHGASWTFVAWGAYQGLFLSLERTKIISNNLKKLPILAQWFYTGLVIIIGFVIFRSKNIFYAKDYLLAMASFSKNIAPISNPQFYLNNFNIFILIVAIIGAVGLHTKITDLSKIKKFTETKWAPAIYSVSYIIIFIICLGLISTESFNPFIYFKF